MLDQQWTLIEKVPEHARGGFDPYADARPVNKGLLAAPGSPRKRRRSFSRSHDGHQTSASRSRSRGRGSKGASPVRGNKGKSRSRSRTRSRSRSAVREATGSFVRMRGSREDNPMRRWTLAMADSCYDGAVLAEFDALHRHGPGSIKDRRPRKRRELALLDEQAEDDVEEMQQMRMDVVYGGPPSEDQHESNAESSQNARRALLSCRELVRAEKVYQTVLLQLLDGKVSVFSSWVCDDHGANTFDRLVLLLRRSCKHICLPWFIHLWSCLLRCLRIRLLGVYQWPSSYSHLHWRPLSSLGVVLWASGSRMPLSHQSRRRRALLSASRSQPACRPRLWAQWLLVGK
jgi:hypothetical protein